MTVIYTHNYLSHGNQLEYRKMVPVDKKPLLSIMYIIL